jgi:hypothetical protein
MRLVRTYSILVAAALIAAGLQARSGAAATAPSVGGVHLPLRGEAYSPDSFSSRLGKSPIQLTLQRLHGYSGTIEFPGVRGCHGSSVLSGRVKDFPPEGVPAFTGGPGGTQLYIRFRVSCSVVTRGRAIAHLLVPAGSVGVAYYGASGWLPAPVDVTVIGPGRGGENRVRVSTLDDMHFTLDAHQTYVIVLYPASY